MVREFWSPRFTRAKLAQWKERKIGPHGQKNSTTRVEFFCLPLLLHTAPAGAGGRWLAKEPHSLRKPGYRFCRVFGRPQKINMKTFWIKILTDWRDKHRAEANKVVAVTRVT
jgi:hypothetical protein